MDKKCRICLGEDESDVAENFGTDSSEESKSNSKNPLIAPCDCTGSSKWVHLECLREWLERNMTEYRTENCVTRVYKINSCEVCQTKFPDQVNIEGHKYEIFKVERPNGVPYLIMEVLGALVGKNIKVLQVPHDRTVILGRCGFCDIIIADESISPRHSKIFYSSLIRKFVL